MKISGWGRYPVIDGHMQWPRSIDDASCLSDSVADNWVPRGQGRSYGDSALAATMVGTDYLDGFVSFDERSGVLRCAAGTTLDEILRVFVPRGWFLPVTPGTKYVSVGGAIASDVHGKNHHGAGTFCEHVESLLVATPGQGLLRCSPTENTAVFRATCAGMGLTGMIVEAAIRLIPIRSACVTQQVHKARNLEQALQLFDEHKGATYSVAWIDCLSGAGADVTAMGRSLVYIGEHADEGGLAVHASGKLVMPMDAPGFVLNPWTIKAFNALYYHRVRGRAQSSTVHYDPYFYPLDGIRHWNRMYGRHGFVQYQFVVPEEAGVEGVASVLRAIARAQKGSFLAVLKAFGPQNENYLSFPVSGYTLALDFKMSADTLAFMNQLDELVAAQGGRLYLAKDARMQEHFFKSSYPGWEKFAEVREYCDPQRRISSLQSQRLGL